MGDDVGLVPSAVEAVLVTAGGVPLDGNEGPAPGLTPLPRWPGKTFADFSTNTH